MIPVIKVEVDNRKLGYSKKEINALTESGYIFLAKKWHSDSLKKHFTAAGAREYKYPARTAKYNKRKQKKYGHQEPLRFSGELMRRASLVRDITGNSKGSKVKMKDLPKYTFMYWVSAGGPKKYEELVEVSQREEVTMKNDLEKYMADSLNKSVRSKFISVTRGGGGGAVAIS